MKLQSCQNCWFNGLQFGDVGLSVGFCARHQKILNLSDELTCGQQVRKDLGFVRAKEVAAVHARSYHLNKIVRLASNEEVKSDYSDSEKDLQILRKDPVGEAVIEYGTLGSTIESLAQLKMLETPRSELAMTSLGRAYVANCMRQGGRWTSGIHLYWWTRKRIAVIPELQVRDLRYDASIQLSRHVELATWSLMMFRLTFLDDIIQHAAYQSDELGRVGDILNSAAEAVQTFSVGKLSRWIGKVLLPALDAKLSHKRYYILARELHKKSQENNERI